MFNLVKDAMPVYKGQICLHLTFKPYSGSETQPRKYVKLPNKVNHAC